MTRPYGGDPDLVRWRMAQEGVTRLSAIHEPLSTIHSLPAHQLADGVGGDAGQAALDRRVAAGEAHQLLQQVRLLLVDLRGHLGELLRVLVALLALDAAQLHALLLR